MTNIINQIVIDELVKKGAPFLAEVILSNNERDEARVDLINLLKETRGISHLHDDDVPQFMIAMDLVQDAIDAIDALEINLAKNILIGILSNTCVKKSTDECNCSNCL